MAVKRNGGGGTREGPLQSAENTPHPTSPRLMSRCSFTRERCGEVHRARCRAKPAGSRRAGEQKRDQVQWEGRTSKHRHMTGGGGGGSHRAGQAAELGRLSIKATVHMFPHSLWYQTTRPSWGRHRRVPLPSSRTGGGGWEAGVPAGDRTGLPPPGRPWDQPHPAVPPLR